MNMRVVWIFAVLVAALVTMQLQLDREGIRRPELRAFVAQPFRAASQPYFATDALNADDPARALAEARRLVLRRPMPAEHLTTLAAAQVQAGEFSAATITIQNAAARGWRDPVAQEAKLRLALEAGDEAEAARRYVALFLQRETSDDLLTNLGSAIFAVAGGTSRREFAAIVAETKRWHALFLRRGLQVLPPEAFAEITARSIADGVQFECQPLKNAIGAIGRRDREAGERLAAASSASCS